jgi:hypothetical protein
LPANLVRMLAIENACRRKAERFIAAERDDDPEFASYLMIEEPELEAGSLKE